MAITRLSLSSILNSPKYDSILANQQSLPSVPTIGTATDGGTGTTVNVAFTAGGIPGSSYTALSTPGSITATGTSSPITVSGLTAGTAYTFQVRATNNAGNSAYSAASNSVTPAVPVYSLVSTFNASGNYTIPTGKTRIAVAGVGSGQGGTGTITNQVSGSVGGSTGPVFIYYDYTVTAGDVVNIVIGAGSAGTTGNDNGASGGVTTVKLNTNTTLLAVDGGVYPNSGGFVTTSNMTLLSKQDGQQGGQGGSQFFPAGVAGNSTTTVVSNITGISSYSAAGSGGGGGYGALSNTNNNNRPGSAGGAGGSFYGGAGGNGGSIAGSNKNSGTPGAAGNGPGGGGGGGGGGARLVSVSTPGQLGGNGANAQILLYVK